MVKKYKNIIEAYLQTPNGKRLLNFAYSFGAAIVILGAMFKILHLPFGNEMLFIGMMTEVFVFIISAFDTPIRDYDWEKVFPVFGTGDPADAPDFSQTNRVAAVNASPAAQANYQAAAQPNEYGMPQPYSTEHPAAQASPNAQPETSLDSPIEQIASVTDNVRKFADATETLTKISESLQASYSHIINNSQDISQHSMGYVQQMENLNRNIAGLNTIYEIQLKSISGQIDTLDHINNGLGRIKNMYDGSVPDSAVFKRETEKMTQQIKELNQVYTRLLQAMTVNMPVSNPYNSQSSIQNP